MSSVTTTVEAPEAIAGAPPVTIEIFAIDGRLANEVRAASGARPTISEPTTATRTRTGSDRPSVRYTRP